MKHKKITALALASLLLFISGCGSSKTDSSAAESVGTESTKTESAGKEASSLTVRFLKVGKADAMIMTCGGETLVLDTGESDDGEELTEKLTAAGADRVDYLIITHFDKDHVGGAAELLEHFDVGTVYLPDYEGTSGEYAAFMAALSENDITPVRLDEDVSFSFGDAEVTINPPSSYEITDAAADYDNNFSLITTIAHGDNTLLFMGDAEKAELSDWLENGNVTDCTLLKVPHHGDYNKALPALIEAVSPEYSVICNSEKNPAEEETLALLETAGAVFETKDGDVTAVSDGETLAVSR